MLPRRALRRLAWARRLLRSHVHETSPSGAQVRQPARRRIAHARLLLLGRASNMRPERASLLSHEAALLGRAIR
jgi:hypothetical protein